MKRIFLMILGLLLVCGCRLPRQPEIEYLRDPDGIMNLPVLETRPAESSSDPGETTATVQVPTPGIVPTALPGIHVPAGKPFSAADQTDTLGIIEIREKLFIASVNDVYLNADYYLGKTIRLEGIFETSEVDTSEGRKIFHYVIRRGPGCCWNDTKAGFEVIWDKNEYPLHGAWVRATGVVEEYFGGRSKTILFLRIRLTALETLDVRGAEYVQN